MVKYIFKQFIRSLGLLIAVTVISFILIVSSDIDPVEAYIGPDKAISEKQREAIVEYWGLDKKPPERFMIWAVNLIHGDLGESIAYRKPVLQVISERFFTSLMLMLTTWVISGVLGFVLGVLSGAYEGSLFDRIVKGFCLILASTPAFWVGILVLMVFVVRLKWFPMGMAVPLGVAAEDVTLGDRIYHLILPAFTLSIVSISGITLHTREKLIGVLQSEPVLFAKARGESKKQIIMRHGIRNIAIPAITIQFLGFSELFGGSLLAEQIFSYPGLGNATVKAASKGDVPLLLALAMFSAIFVFAGNLIANILYGVLDPRIRERERMKDVQ